MMSVSIIGATFYGNRGAEAMLSSAIGVLREQGPKDLMFNVFSYYPAADRGLVSDPRVSVYSATPVYLVSVLLPGALLFRLFGWLRLTAMQRILPESVRALAGSSAHLCLAGVSFVDGRTKFIPFNIATLLPAMVLDVPVIKLSQAMGPFKTRTNRLAARVFLGRCHTLFARGEKTQRHLLSLLGAKSIIQRADDVAFLFRPDHCLSRSAAGLEAPLARLAELGAGGRTLVGVCPSVVVAKRASAAGQDYPERIQALIKALVMRGYGVALYPNATRGDDMTKSHNNDLPMIESILRGLEPQVCRSVVGFDGSWNAAQIHRIVASCDLHVVSRFHAMVAALTAAVPVVVIGWSHKYLEVMARFGQEDMVLDADEGELEPVLARIDQLTRERAERSARITQALSEVQALSRVQFDRVLGLLGGGR